MEYLGIDLRKRESPICLLTETGEVIERLGGIPVGSRRISQSIGGMNFMARVHCTAPCNADQGKVMDQKVLRTHRRPRVTHH
jgi:hypothetical protein